MGISAIDNAVTAMQQFSQQADHKSDKNQITILPAVTLPPADPSRPFGQYELRARHAAYQQEGRWSFLTAAERSDCEELSKLDDINTRKYRIGAATGAVIGLSAGVLRPFLKNQNFDAEKTLMDISLGATLGLGTTRFFGRMHDTSGLNNCDKMHNERLAAAAKAVYDAAKAQEDALKRVGVSAEAMAANRPSALGLFARDAANAAKVGAAVIVGAASAALFIAGFRAMPSAMSGTAPAGFGAGVMPSAESYDRNVF